MILPKIRTFREYNVKHKLENINIGIGKNTVRISPIPGSFKISDGPLAEYQIENDSLGQFTSYFIDVDLNTDLEISDYKATFEIYERH